MADKRHVMYIFNDTGFGGAGQSLFDTLTEIKEDVNPIVITRDDAMVESKFTEFGIRCYKIHFSTDFVKIGSVNENRRGCDFKQGYEAALQLLPIIEKENIQLIHINSSVSYFAAIAALMAKIPYIWHIRELLEEQFNCQFLNEQLKISLYKKADKLIAISDYVKDKYYEKYSLNTIRMYNGLNIKRFKKPVEVRKQYTNTFIVAAMITPEKGQWDVIQAAELLVKRGYTDVKITIVGNGKPNYIWALKKYIMKKKLEKNIRILPFQNDLSDLRGQVCYSITSSQNEALGRVTIEAMLAGNVVIGARSGGTTEIIGADESCGFLYELGNVVSLANTMEEAINSRSGIKNAIAQKAQQYAEETFDSKQYCKDMVKLYDEVIHSFEPCEYSSYLKGLQEAYNTIKDTKKFEEKDNIILYKKLELMFTTALKWLEIRQMQYSLDEYFRSNHIGSIAIYGMGVLGCRLYDELEDSDIKIKYLIDKNPNGMDKVLKFVSLDKEKLDVDVIVVTVIFSEKQVIDDIRMGGYENVIGLSDILNSYDK